MSATPGPWYAQVDDLIGGWMIATVDKPASQISNRREDGEMVVGEYLREEDARLIAKLRNWQAEYAWMGTDDEVERGDLQRAIRELAS
jgi:hypothetical protein